MSKKRNKISKIDTKDVLVVSFSDVNELDNGFNHYEHKNIYSKFNSGKYISHYNLDKCIEITQVVPFLILRNEKMEYLVIRRSDAPVNKLNDLYSIGLYDHIYPEDGYSDPLFDSLVRILHTNIIKYKPAPFKHVGYVKDVKQNDNHLGIVFVLDTLSIGTEPFNKKYICEWFTKEQLIDNYSRFKSWSQYIINYIIDNDL